MFLFLVQKKALRLLLPVVDGYESEHKSREDTNQMKLKFKYVWF
jgi:hypothetical protein